MSREMNPNLYPPGGYKFRDRDGVVHKSESWRKLEAMVRDYRTRNQMEVGDVWAEIMGQICSEVPSYCHEAPAAPMPKKGHSITFNQRVMIWLASAMTLKRIGRWHLVDDSVAAERAKICATCPQQLSLNRACMACITTIDRSRDALLAGTNARHLNLNPCSVLGEDCATTVHADLPRTSNDSLPAHCWRKG